MSKSVVPAAAVAHAKHLVNNKKLTKQVSGKKPADTDAQAVDHKDEAVNVATVQDAQHHSMSMSDAAISDFSFAGALASAASSTSALAAEGAQADGGYSDDDSDGSGTIVAIGAAGLAILGGVVAFSGGGKSNKAPTVSAATQTVTTKEDTAATVTVSASDPNSDPLTYSASGATKGTVTGGTNGVFTYTPNANFNGTDTFTVTVNGGKGGTVTQTVTVTVTAVNDAPVVDKATVTATTAEDTALTGQTVVTDPDGATTLTYTIATAAANGTVTIGADGKYTYTPKANFNGSDSFTVKASDGTDSVSQVVNVTVTPVDDAATGPATQAVTGNEDTAIAGTVTIVDPDSTLTYTVTKNGTNGTATVGADGKFVFTPNANFNGTDSFVVTASDGKNTTTQTINVTVASVADNPVADSISTTKVTVAEDASAEIIVAFTDPDAPADTNLKFALTDTPDNGKLTTNAAGNLVYTPNANFNGTDAFSYTITDNNGGSTTVTVPITVTAVNDAPVLTDVPALSTTGGTVSFTPVATDVDGNTVTFTTTDPAGGAVTKNSDGSFTYKADTGFTGADTFTLTASDGQGGVDTQVVTVTTAPTGPVITTKSIDIGSPSDPATTVVASDASYVFTDDAKVNTNVSVFGFTSDDEINVANATSSDYNYTASNGDLIISFNNGAQVNLITIEDVLAANAVVFNYATAQAAIGNPDFMTFG